MMFFLSLVTMLIVAISCGNKSSEKELMANSQIIDDVRADQLFLITAIDSIAGTDLNLVTVMLAVGGHQEYIKEQSGTLINAICPKTRNLTIGEPTKLLRVDYQHNAAMRKSFYTIK